VSLTYLFPYLISYTHTTGMSHIKCIWTFRLLSSKKKYFEAQPILSPVAFGIQNRDFILFFAWSDGKDIKLQMGVETHTTLHMNCLLCLIFARSVVTVHFFRTFSNIRHHPNALSSSWILICVCMWTDRETDYNDLHRDIIIASKASYCEPSLVSVWVLN
jgi:hypothetical protein